MTAGIILGSPRPLKFIASLNNKDDSTFGMIWTFATMPHEKL